MVKSDPIKWILGLALFQASCAVAAQPLSTDAAGQPVNIVAGSSYDLTSSRTGETYRLFVRVPPGPPPAGGFPVIYILDGSWYFNTASSILGLQTGVREVSPAILVGMGYPESELSAMQMRRYKDLSLPAAAETLPPGIRRVSPETGGADDFLAFLNEEAKPFVERLAPVNRGCQTLYGHSLGGLFVLHALFQTPGSFQSYIAASPAIWWGDRAVLAGIENLLSESEKGELGLRLLLTAARLEQPLNVADPVVAERVAKAAMVDNAADLAQTLSAFDPNDLRVSHFLFEEETHNSVIPASISRAYRFGINCPPPTG